MIRVALNCRWIVLLLLASVAFSQEKQKKEPKPFIPPPDVIVHGVLFAAVVPKDLGCAKDYLKIMALEGIEQRKQMVDLVRYGCASVITSPYNVTGKEPVVLSIDKTSVRFLHVLLVRDDLLADVTAKTKTELGTPSIEEPLTVEGWLREQDILKLTKEQVIATYPGALQRFVALLKEIRR